MVSKSFGILMKTTSQSKLFFEQKSSLPFRFTPSIPASFFRQCRIFKIYVLVTRHKSQYWHLMCQAARPLEFTLWSPDIYCYWYSIVTNIWSAEHLDFTFWLASIIVTDNQSAGRLESTFGLAGIIVTDNQSVGHLEFTFWLPSIIVTDNQVPGI